MGDQAPESGAQSDKDGAPEFKPITSQDEFNRMVAERVNRERSKFADYSDLKAKASRLDELEAATKSEADKARERAEAAERERDAARVDALRLRVAAKHGLTDDEAESFLHGTDEASLTSAAEKLAALKADRKKNGNRVPSEGTTPPPPSADPKIDFIRSIAGRD